MAEDIVVQRSMDALDVWDEWHDKVCNIASPLCSRHAVGNWPHLVDDALKRTYLPPLPRPEEERYDPLS